jgi:hypothetical protein
METPWKWFTRADARTVFLCFVLGFICITAWWAWKEITPEQMGEARSSGPGERPVHRGLATLGFVNKQASLGHGALLDPFTIPGPDPAVDPGTGLTDTGLQLPDTSDALVKVESWRPRELYQKGDAPTGQPAGASKRTLPEQVATAVPPVTVALTYRGVLKRPDGQVVALIEDSDSGRGAFYPAGEKMAEGLEVFDLLIAEARTSELFVLSPAGQLVRLELGQPVTFREERHGL